MTPDFDALIDRETSAYAAKVSPSTIAVWASRGWKDPTTGERCKLVHRGVNGNGYHLYRYGDVLAAEKATRGRGQARNWSLLNLNTVMAHAS